MRYVLVSAIMLMACLSVIPAVHGMAMRVPPDLEKTINLDLGDTYESTVTVVGDQQRNDVVFFVSLADPELLVVEGTRILYEDEFVLDPNEVRDFTIEFEAIGQKTRDVDTTAVVGFRFVEDDAQSQGIGLEQVISKTVSFEIDGAGVPRTTQDDGGSSSSGGSGFVPQVNTESSDTPSDNDEDPVLEDTTPQNTAFNTAVVDTTQTRTGNQEGSTIRAPASAEGKASAMMLLGLLVLTMIINLAAIQYVRSEDE